MLPYLILLMTFFGGCHSVMRNYYMAAVDVEWDYAPTETNIITNTTIQENSIEAEFLIDGTNRIGGKYGKSVFVEYTDDTFTEQKPKADWQGILGPIIKGEVGDKIDVVFRNLATRPYSLHTHGVLYDKSSEGAKYEDQTSAKQRLDDSVAPGSNHTYHFVVADVSGPAEGDPNCIAWPYHSHIITSSGTNTGMVGALVICRKGILDESGQRTDVDKDFVLLVTVTDENLSYHIDDNIQKYCTDPASVDPEDESFQESNKMHSINGYVFGNLPGLDMCQGDKVAWHVFSLGTETDLHTLLFHGNMLNILNHRRDSFGTTPGVFVTGEMDAVNAGTWLMRSEVNTHFHAGTSALYKVNSTCGNNMANPTIEPIKTREYFLQAEESIWDYAPSGMDGSYGTSLTDTESPAYPLFTKDGDRIGGKYKKVRYFRYTDATFSTLEARTNQEIHLGFLGPVLRAEVGDEIVVTFRNNASREYSIFAHGVMYDKANEGAGYADETTGSDRADNAVAPGQSYTYRWTVPEPYAPTEADDNCITWLYYSVVDPERDVYSGLVGPLLVCKPGTLNDSGKQKDLLEYHLFMTKVDENKSWYIEENIERFTTVTPNDVLMADEEFIESNIMYAINGYSYANLPGLNGICLDQEVSWHMSALGGDTDQHTVHFRGHTVTLNGRHVDTVNLAPGISATTLMKPIKTGTWEIECMTNSHYVYGMKALYTVNATCNDATEMPTAADSVRTFYIAATEIEWDYAPDKFNLLKNESLLNEDSSGNVFVKKEGPFIGSVYKKAVYRQYVDDTFTTMTSRDQPQQHLGVLGPVIHAEVGDQIQVVFKNMASRNYSIYLHGLMYENRIAGAKHGRMVGSGDILTYTWNVPDEAGPGVGDQDCVLYAYYSDVDRVQDTHSGLIGPLVICAKGTLKPEMGLRIDVDREFVLLFNVFDENQSWYLDENIQMFSPEPNAVDKSDEEFEESNLMHGINGFLFGNLKHLEMYLDETVEWYLISVGEEVDIHTVHFHGQSVIYQQYSQHRTDVIELFPGVFSTVQMKLKRAGHWLLHCHVNDHLLGGMVTTYEVKEANPGPIVDPDPSATPDPSGQMAFVACPAIVITNVLLVLLYSQREI